MFARRRLPASWRDNGIRQRSAFSFSVLCSIEWFNQHYSPEEQLYHPFIFIPLAVNWSGFNDQDSPGLHGGIILIDGRR